MRPKILFICTASPFGTSGSGVRTLHLAKLLERIGPVTMVVATGRDWTPEQLRLTRETFNVALYVKYEAAPIRGLANRWRQLFDPRFMNSNGVIAPAADMQKVNALVESHDVVWVHTIKVANAFRRFNWPKTVLDIDDIPSRYHRLAIPHAKTWKEKARRHRGAFVNTRSERLCLERFPIMTLCKEDDRALFGNDPRVHVVPNGFAAPAAAPAWQPNVAGPRLGMIGDFKHLPNYDGLKWFVENVWSEVLHQIPTAQLRLVGKGGDTIAPTFNSRNVAGLGYVPDTGAEIATWSLMIVPTRLGGGSHLKVAEGLARRTPIVTTPHGARGYSIEHQRQALIVDSAADFTAACLRLLREPAEGKRLSDAGWELFNQKYSWDAIGPAVTDTVNHCLSLSRSPHALSSPVVSDPSPR